MNYQKNHVPTQNITLRCIKYLKKDIMSTSALYAEEYRHLRLENLNSNMPETIQIPRAWLEELLEIDKDNEKMKAGTTFYEARLHAHIESAKSLLTPADNKE